MANVVPGMKPSTSYESIVDKGMSREGQTVTRWQKGVIVRFGFGFVGRSGVKRSSNGYSAIKTPEIIFPVPDSSDRKNEFVSATFNMVATMVGGSILSLPYAIRETGIFLGMLLLGVSVAGTYFSLDILCSCARRSGVTSYIGVAKVAFGSRGSVMVTILLLIFTVFVLIAYMVFLRDIWTGIFEFALGIDLTTTGSLYVLFSMLVVCFPACLAKEFYALRHMCYISFVAAIILVLALGYRCVTYNMENPDVMRTQAVLVSKDWDSILSAFPLFALSFMCHFNILSVHSELINPTRERVRSVIGMSMSIATVIYVLLCLFGYLYAYELTSDDILLNFKPSDKIMLLGRFGFGLSMLVAIPVLVLPTRNTVESLYGEVRNVWCTRDSSTESENEPLNGADIEKTVAKEDLANDERAKNMENMAQSFWESASHILLTVGILGFCFVVTNGVPGVGVVWSICGSSISLFVAFFLPSVFYPKIRRKKKRSIRRTCCVVSIFVCSIVMIL